MLQQQITSHDQMSLTVGHTEVIPNRPWLVFIIPFGLQVTVANAFFSKFETKYNIVTWEARAILAPAHSQFAPDTLSVENHTADLFTTLAHFNIEQCSLIGYCSGAGIAIAAANKQPEKFTQLLLVNGEYTLLNEAACLTQYGRDIDSLLPLAANNLKTAQFILERMGAGSDESLPAGFNMPFSQVHFFHRYAINYVAYRAVNFAELATAIQLKTLVISGEQDKQANTNSSERIKQAIHNAQIYIDPQGDHYGAITLDSNTLTLIDQFLNGQI